MVRAYLRLYRPSRNSCFKRETAKQQQLEIGTPNLDQSSWTSPSPGFRVQEYERENDTRVWMEHYVTLHDTSTSTDNEPPPPPCQGGLPAAELKKSAHELHPLPRPYFSFTLLSLRCLGSVAASEPAHKKTTTTTTTTNNNECDAVAVYDQTWPLLHPTPTPHPHVPELLHECPTAPSARSGRKRETESSAKVLLAEAADSRRRRPTAAPEAPGLPCSKPFFFIIVCVRVVFSRNYEFFFLVFLFPGGHEGCRTTKL